jgi:hypothetical protein
MLQWGEFYKIMTFYVQNDKIHVSAHPLIINGDVLSCILLEVDLPLNFHPALFSLLKSESQRFFSTVSISEDLLTFPASQITCRCIAFDVTVCGNKVCVITPELDVPEYS